MSSSKTSRMGNWRTLQACGQEQEPSAWSRMCSPSWPGRARSTSTSLMVSGARSSLQAQLSMPPASTWASTSSLTQNAWPSMPPGVHKSEEMFTSTPQLRWSRRRCWAPTSPLGRGVTVGEGVRLHESIVLHGATLQEHTCVLHTIVGWGSTVGHWARVQGTPNDPNPNNP
uniref:Mannose-1-phosphate guanyltransferase-like n=1 Tax=Callorhinus ursinus TaxID=34884 RepID=A0A3Q7PI32_CALUR|nr:mannose-1-phosphate guanyltransferase-like [Callorhinus ursinus]